MFFWFLKGEFFFSGGWITAVFAFSFNFGFPALSVICIFALFFVSVSLGLLFRLFMVVVRGGILCYFWSVCVVQVAFVQLDWSGEWVIDSGFPPIVFGSCSVFWVH